MELTTHYNDTVTLEFDPVKHYYTINGEKAWGVTTALQVLAKPALIPWATGCASKYFEENVKPGQCLDEVQIANLAKEMRWAYKNRSGEAADMGTWVHKFAEDYVLGKNPTEPVNPKLQKAVRSFKKWFDESDIEVISSEQKLCSRKHRLAGTVDLICKLDGKLTIVDWKTGSGIYPEMMLQMGAYSEMYEEEFGKKVEQVGVVNCSVKRSFQTKFDSNVEQHRKTYLDVLNIKKRLDALEESF